jgi:hypothetical protein
LIFKAQDEEAGWKGWELTRGLCVMRNLDGRRARRWSHEEGSNRKKKTGGKTIQVSWRRPPSSFLSFMAGERESGDFELTPFISFPLTIPLPP